MSRVGRNDPCPCGSGLKYKKCCAARDVAALPSENARAMKVHNLDEIVVDRLLKQARKWSPPWAQEVAMDYAPEDPQRSAEELQFVLPWALYHRALSLDEERTPVERYMDEQRNRLSAEERAWMEAQQAAWMSVWEVTEVEPGSWLRVHDLLTGEKRIVHEVSGSQSLPVRSAILGRIIDYDGLSLLCGIHPHALPPHDGAQVLESFRRAQGKREGWLPADLRAQDVTLELIALWQLQLEDAVARASRPRRLTNRDGDALVIVEDPFHFRPEERHQVLEALGALPRASLQNRNEEVVEVTLLRATPACPDTVVAQIEVGPARGTIRTNSRPRANTARDQVEAACGDLVRRGRRTVKEMKDALSERSATARPSEAPPQTPEMHAAVRSMKEKHYADWDRTKIPALQGRTPREAIQTPAGRAQVDLLLKEMERLESHCPVEARFDVRTLRRALQFDD